MHELPNLPASVPGTRRAYSAWRAGLAVFLLALVPLSCSAPGFLVTLAPTTPTPSASSTPQVIIVVATPTAAVSAPVASGQISEGADPVELRRIAVYQQAAPAVVNITTQVLTSDYFWGNVPEEGSGSGFLWDQQGHIVTNYHVVQGAQRIEVSFGGDTGVPATVVGTDPLNDLAVIRVDTVPQGVTPLQAGTSANLQVGQTAIVIGNPFGQFQRTMTMGIISAVKRTIETDNTVLRGVIQTDAAINRGNSGGPLLDSAGRLIGVNSAIYSPSGTSAGVGLAIPVDKVSRVIPVLIKEGRYPHPWLGIEELGYELTPTLARALDLSTERGLLVARLYRNSPADQAGLQSAQQEMVIGNRRYLTGGDVVTAIDGQALAKWADLSEYLEEHTTVGQTVTLTVKRADKEVTIKATLEDTPDSLRPG